MADLFASQDDPAADEARDTAPLADRLRPRTLADVVGQEHLTGADGAIGRMVAAGRLSSIIFWGPPGTGKTTISRLLADAVGMRFEPISAVFSGVADLKKVFAAARDHARQGAKTLLFVDEIHRFNRAQQDSFLPFVEDGTVTLVGATTENPSFELNAALLSRAQVLILRRLDAAAGGGIAGGLRGGGGAGGVRSGGGAGTHALREASRVQLTEVVRCSKRIIAGAMAFQLGGDRKLLTASVSEDAGRMSASSGTVCSFVPARNSSAAAVPRDVR